MPRLHIHVHDIDEIADLEDQAEWEAQLGRGTDQRRELNTTTDTRNRGRGERRFGGSEALDRKRADRRKHVGRSVRRD